MCQGISNKGYPSVKSATQKGESRLLSPSCIGLRVANVPEWIHRMPIPSIRYQNTYPSANGRELAVAFGSMQHLELFTITLITANTKGFLLWHTNNFLRSIPGRIQTAATRLSRRTSWTVSGALCLRSWIAPNGTKSTTLSCPPRIATLNPHPYRIAS